MNITPELRQKLLLLVDIAHQAEHALDDSCEDDWTASHYDLNDKLDTLLQGYDDVHELVNNLKHQIEEL